MVGDLGHETLDPFERDEEGLLLVESFARLGLNDKRAARRWFPAHGVADQEGMFPDGEAPQRVVDPSYVDNLGFVTDEQDNVRWHLLSLALLSEHREAGRVPSPDRRPHRGWQPSWAQPALVAPSETLWLGATSDVEGHIGMAMHDHARPEDAPEDLRVSGRTNAESAWIRDVWWPAAHAAWLRILDDGVPIVVVQHPDWVETWREWQVDKDAAAGRLPSGPLHADWQGLLDLQRLLITPYVQRAAAHEIVVGRADGEGGASGPISVREQRLWTSILAPIYLQLFEGLRRVSEGHSGATWCRECRLPFLTLDARRSSFCNDRERHRWSQRERRRRLDEDPIPWKAPPR